MDRRSLPLLLAALSTSSCHDVPSGEPPVPTTAAIADVLEESPGRHPHMSGDVHRLAGARMAGPAVTVRLVRDEQASVVTAGLRFVELLEEAEPGSVVVAVLDDGGSAAVVGEAFAVLARSRRLAGFVVDGSVRDVERLRVVDVPVFARGTAPGSAGGHYRVDGVNVPVVSGGAAVSPGDLIVGDADGVVVVPSAAVERTLEGAARKVERDRVLVRLIAETGSYRLALDEMRAAAGAESGPPSE